MINAWSLLYEELNGTMDKTYPVKNNELNGEDIVINTGTGDTIFNVPSDVNDLDDDIEHSDAWYDYTRNDPDRENPFTDPKDRARADRVVGKTNVPDPDGGINTEKGYIPDDTITITGGDTIDFDDMPLSFNTFADNDDSIAHHIGFNTGSAETLNIDLSGIEGINLSSAYNDDVVTFGGDTKPEPNLDFKSQKYEEDKGIKDLKDYISSTYKGHYTSEQNSTQTLDLIQSVGDAESFCRSNAIKYLARYDKKGSAKQDILKAMHYCLLLYYFSGNTQEPDYTNTRYETF